MRKVYHILIAMLCAIFWTACNTGPTDPSQIETAVSGKVYISVDESFKPIIKAQTETFMGLYEYATVVPSYTSEADAMARMFASDSVRMAVVSRDLTLAEKQQFEKMKIVPRVFKFAIDAVALITNPNSIDSLITLSELRDLMTNSTSNSRYKDTKLVFDNNSSSNLTHLQRLLGVSELNKDKVFALKSNEEVLDYISKNNNAIGVIGVCWISDLDSPKVQRFRAGVKVMGVSAKGGAESEYVWPYQAYLMDSTYSLRRDIYMISREARSGLGSGFMTFVGSDKGQRIVLKSGLLPATMPTRMVEIKGGMPN